MKFEAADKYDAAYWKELSVSELIEKKPTWVKSWIRDGKASEQDWENAVHFAAEHSKSPGETANLGHVLKSFKETAGAS